VIEVRPAGVLTLAEIRDQPCPWRSNLAFVAEIRR
jgi:hypothetical protein